MRKLPMGVIEKRWMNESLSETDWDWVGLFGPGFSWIVMEWDRRRWCWKRDWEIWDP